MIDVNFILREEPKKLRVLVVVDMQIDFVTGSLGTDEAKIIVPNVKRKIDKYYGYRTSKIFYTKDTHHSDYLSTQEGKFLPIEHCIADTRGWDFVDDIREFAVRDKAEDIIEKETFGTTKLCDDIEYLTDTKGKAKLDSIELCGLCTDICVITNALLLKTYFPEIPIYVDPNCCAGTTLEKHLQALSIMDSCHIITRRPDWQSWEPLENE